MAHAEVVDLASGLFQGGLAKREGTVLRLAGIIQLIEWAYDDRFPPPPEKIEIASVDRAIKFVDTYFTPMAERTFGDALLSADERRAAQIAKLIFKGKVGTKRDDGRLILNASKLRKMKLPGLRKAIEVTAAIERLEEAGWVRPAPSRTGEHAGRQTTDYEINPRVLL